MQDYVDHKESDKYETMIPPKETNKIPVTNSKEMEVYDLHDKDFKIIILKKLNEMEENTDRQQNEIRKATHEQNEKFSGKKQKPLKKKEKKNQTEILELKNTIKKQKKSIDRFNNRLDHIVERVCKLRDHLNLANQRNKKKKNEKEKAKKPM